MIHFVEPTIPTTTFTMSEINVTAVIYPQPDKFDEVR
jgi:hypothetical protein